MMKRHAPNLAPRLLDKGQAAAYCGVCVAVFETSVGVAAIEVKPGLKRWDRHALDRWIDALNGELSGDLGSAWDDWHGRKERAAS
jgi:hypothetical protein